MRTLVQRLKRLWNTPVEFYGVDRPEPQAGPWQGLMLFVILLMVLGLLWLIRYLPERTYLVYDRPDAVREANVAVIPLNLDGFLFRRGHAPAPLSDWYPSKIGPYLKRMETEEIDTRVVEA
jgi:hypothetical protein